MGNKFEHSAEQYSEQIVAWYKSIHNVVEQSGVDLIVVSGDSALISRRIAEILFPDIQIVEIPNPLNKQIQQIGINYEPEDVSEALHQNYPLLFDGTTYPLFLDDHARNFSKSFAYSYNLSKLGLGQHKILPLFQFITSIEKISSNVDSIADVLQSKHLFYSDATRYNIFEHGLIVNVLADENYAIATADAMYKLANEMGDSADPRGLVERSIFIQLAIQASRSGE
ncbi:hypothetical protein KC640_00720 [Candidatus Dojkabacteria bacterium]|uniref:Uncharacterized protein n=1 Tax=Candidatus Dojkabacteria bacterium TaxID=2099670 RepID=A0A955I5F9_9BACT|nr:hypothetical protein [Candidatus Dojkabacteria bacterium]